MVQVGDILKFTFNPEGNESGHFFVKVKEIQENGEIVGELHDRGTASLYDDTEIGFGPIYVGQLGASLTKVEAPSLSFVGPEPKAPAVTTPFKVSQVHGHRDVLQDSRGLVVARFSGDDTAYAEDAELAALVVRLLNAHFGAK